MALTAAHDPLSTTCMPLMFRSIAVIDPFLAAHLNLRMQVPSSQGKDCGSVKLQKRTFQLSQLSRDVPADVLARAHEIEAVRLNYSGRELVGFNYIDDALLTDGRDRYQQACMTAAAFFWRAVADDPDLGQENRFPMHRCILAAHACRDILHGMGFAEAKLEVVGVRIQQSWDGTTINYLGVGLPSSPFDPNGWNAHLVVRVGDVLLDPTSGQRQRIWNASPDYSTSLFLENGGRMEIERGVKCSVLADQTFSDREFDYRLAYFKLPRALARSIGPAERLTPEASADCSRLVVKALRFADPHC